VLVFLRFDQITGLCLDKFPGITNGTLGMAVNGKLTVLRNKKEGGKRSELSD
jgi:hypothetical protein